MTENRILLRPHLLFILTSFYFSYRMSATNCEVFAVEEEEDAAPETFQMLRVGICVVILHLSCHDRVITLVSALVPEYLIKGQMTTLVGLYVTGIVSKA